MGLAVCSLQTGHWNDFVTHMQNAYCANGDQVWEVLAEFYPTKLNVFHELSKLSAESVTGACEWLLPAVGKLQGISLTDAISLLRFADRLPLSYRHAPAEQLAPHVAACPALGIELGEFLRVTPEAHDISGRVWAGAFASGASGEATSYVVRLITGVPRDSELLASLLAFLPLDGEDALAVLTSVEPTLANTIVRAIPELGQDAWAALCLIADSSPTAQKELQSALDGRIPDAIHAISNTLFLRKTPDVGVTGAPLVDLVRRLLQAGLEVEQCRGHVDVAVSRLFIRPALRSTASQCVKELYATESDAVSAFGQIFGALENHPPEFVQILTDWLLQPDANFDSIRSLLSKCALKRSLVRLDDLVFAAATRDRQVKAIRRLLALTHHGPTLCLFSLCIAEMNALGPERFELVGQMLDMTFAEYPGVTAAFLKKMTSELPRHAPETVVFRTVYANVLRWRRVLERLPQRKELRPSVGELQALRARKLRMNREIMRQAAERSIFRDVFMNMHLAQGRKFATHISSGPPQIVELKESSHSVELPSSELADPMRGRLERSNLLRSAR
ncbi:hypothetical protein GXB81_14960 [Paraburkholderia sp. Ac-20336]|uniref:hypothetical protein n=1 Tax=Paraburkholderia sp. Ac-20336 TaxID=2703886 RepID=UPI0019813700|nr:hypothetical protein [Paraburkholderia sp. Ac-20336]MBN3804340.1 hypothetical protein [Paraburkholderia sp. Ac-20336]